MNKEIKNALFTSFVLVVAVVILYLLYTVRGVIPPIIFGAVIAYVLLPVTNFFEKLKFPRSLASFVTLLLFFFVIILLSYFLLPLILRELIELGHKIPNLQENISSFFENLGKVLNAQVESAFVRNIISNATTTLQSVILNFISNFAKQAGSTLSNIGSLVISFLLAYFFMKDSKALYRITLRRFDPRIRVKIKQYLDRTNSEMRTYFSTLVIISIIVGFFMGLGSFIAGVKYAVFIGFIDSFLEMLPYIGPTIVFLTGALLSLTQGFKTFLAFIIVFSIVEGLFSNGILPHMVGDKLKVPPVIIILMIAIGGAIFGPLGVLIATPTFLILRNIRIIFS
ncbi:MAG: AI-2E family transporter [Caldisericum sp.]|jgi:predicted PurR-regulated permease PerM|nr:AI-2E family transporter [Caldisericum sp.]